MRAVFIVFCTVLFWELLPTDHKVSKAMCAVMFGVELGYCAASLLLNHHLCLGRQLVVSCVFALGKRGIKIGDLLSCPPLPVLRERFKTTLHEMWLPRTTQWSDNHPVWETAVIVAVDTAENKSSFMLSSMVLRIFWGELLSLACAPCGQHIREREWAQYKGSKNAFF